MRADRSEAFAPARGEVAHRSFLERQNHDSTQLKTHICAMLTSESARGGASNLKRQRLKSLGFFETGLPDPTSIGFSHLDDEEFEEKYKGSLRLLYHHVSESTVARSSRLGAKMCLGSATPTLHTFL